MSRMVKGQGVGSFTAASRRAYAKMPPRRKAEVDRVAAMACLRLRARGVHALGDQLVRDLMAAAGRFMIEEGIGR